MWPRRDAYAAAQHRARSTSLRLAIALVAAALVAPATAGAATLTPVADAYVDAATPTSNNGLKPILSTDADLVRNSYLRFSVPGAASQSSATLRVFAETSNSVGFQVRAVAGDTWSETAINFNNAPTAGSVIASSGRVTANTWYSLNVSAALTGDDLISLALTSTSSTATRYTSREGTNKPQLIVPAATPPNAFDVTGSGSSYRAESPGGTVYTGTLKVVVELAVSDLKSAGGGRITFASGTFDLGPDWFDLNNADDIIFEGQGVGATTLRNNSSAATDTEPFDTGFSDRMIIRNMTIAADGPSRSTSDAIDFDGSVGTTVENVRITDSRGRGIVFDGKDLGRDAHSNTIRNCTITGVPSDGIELLAAHHNTITGCTVTNTGGHGIQLTKGSTSAGQPNKKASGNTVTGNTVDNAGQDGINVNSSDDNMVRDNTVTNSSNVTAGRDGIRIGSADNITCDRNQVIHNTATDNQQPKTQRYGLHIQSPLCHDTNVLDNTFDGNLVGPILDRGTNTTTSTPMTDAAIQELALPAAPIGP